MSTPRQPTEEELREAYEAELKRLRVEDVVLQTVISFINLGGRKAGLAPDTQDEVDPLQLGMAIEGVRRLLPLVEDQLGADAQQLRDAVAQLQLAYVRLGGPAPAEDAPAAAPDPTAGAAGPAPSGPAGPAGPASPGGGQSGPAERSGRLWVPGQ